MKKQLHNFLKNRENKPSSKKLQVYIYILICIGIIIMLVSNMTSTFMPDEQERLANSEVEEHAREPHPNTIAEYEKYYETQLKEILSEVVGVSNVSVKVNIATTEKKIHEKNRRNEKQITEEKDQEGGTRTIENHSIDEQVVIINNGEQDEAVVIGTEKPKVIGVIVVAQGAENLQVKQQIIEAVTRFLHIPSHQVSVLPKKIKED